MAEVGVASSMAAGALAACMGGGEDVLRFYGGLVVVAYAPKILQERPSKSWKRPKSQWSNLWV